MVENQLKRRNVNSLTKTYLVGRRYLLEKKDWGDRKSVGKNYPLKRSSELIAEQLSLGEKTVRRAAEFTQAVDTVVQNTGCKVNDILSKREPYTR